MANKKQTTGSFFGDLMKAIKAGGSSKLLKNYKIKKNDTASTIAKKEGFTLRQLMSLNPGLEQGNQAPLQKEQLNKRLCLLVALLKYQTLRHLKILD